MPATAAIASSKRRSEERQGSEKLNRSTSPAAGRGAELSESTPTLRGERYFIKASLDDLDFSDSAKSNRELYLVNEHEEDAKLRHRSTPQNEGQGGPRNAQHHHSSTSKQTTLAARENLNKNTAIESMPSPKENQHHSWLKAADDLRKLIGKFVNDYRIQNAVLLLIAINAIMMGVATFPVVKQNPYVFSAFDTTDKVFLVLFTVESSMQLIYYGWKLFKDGFLVFDLLIVVMSWALVGVGAGANTQVFRAFRIFRAMRLITRIETLKNLILALISVFPKMTAIFMFLCLIFYIFAVMFTQLFKGMFDKGQVDFPYFESIFLSLFTLFQMMTLDEWYDVLAAVQETYSWAWVFFLMFIIITAFVVVNLIIAVICDAVHVMGNDDKAALVGYESEEAPSEGMDSNFYDGGINHIASPASTEQRLQGLQQKLDEMMLVQDQMKTSIELLIQQLKDNATRKVGSLPINSKGQALPSKGGEGLQSHRGPVDSSDSRSM